MISGNESFYASEGYVKIFDFLSKSFRFTVPKIFLGEPSSVSFISAIKKILERRGEGASRFCVEIFCLTVTEFFIGEHFGLSEKFSCRKFSCIGGGESWFCGSFLSYRTETKNFVK